MQRFKIVIATLWLLALTLAGWTVSQLPFGAIGSSIAALRVSDWAIWIAINAVILSLPALRWELLTRSLGSAADFPFFFQLRQAGGAISFLTPGPHFGGEPFQLYWLYQLKRMPLHRATLSLGLDRFFEILVNISVVLSGILLLVITSTLAGSDWIEVAVVLSLLFVLVLGLGIALTRQPQWLSTRLEKLAHRWQEHPRLSRIDCQWQQFGLELRSAITTKRSRLLVAVLLSVLGWMLLLVELALLLHFLGLDLAPVDFVLILVGMRLAMLLPAPGGIGPVEASLLWSFNLLQLPPEAAIGLIALTRLRDAAVLATGLLCLYRLQRSVKRKAAP